LSVFAVSSGGTGTASATGRADAPAGPCGMCGDPRGPGSCSVN
jgi:hypothetical protein